MLIAGIMSHAFFPIIIQKTSVYGEANELIDVIFHPHAILITTILYYEILIQIIYRFKFTARFEIQISKIFQLYELRKQNRIISENITALICKFLVT